MSKNTTQPPQRTAITPTRSQNYPEWYQEVIKAAELAENSPVRGCMVIKPWGYALWEKMQQILDGKFKETGHVNAYFPLLIPLSFLEKEAEHVEGFAKECAVVTHHRLKADSQGKLQPDPSSALEEPHVIRPTSETIIGHMYAKWVKSYRDLPLLMNQWCNVMRWEMRTRLFLRTTEFLWQEGHTVHATSEEAIEETLRMLDIYADFAENYLAIPVIKGEKTKDERFPGAVQTYTIEAMMQDGKALQAGTSHFLGQNFAQSSGIKFLNKSGTEEVAWTTSWGVSTRMIGGLIMTHSDDNGLVLPPKIAPIHVVILPIYRNDEQRKSILDAAQKLANEIKSQTYNQEQIKVKIDDRDLSAGEKSWQAVKHGYPIRIEIGPRDLENGQITYMRRDQEPKEKHHLSLSETSSKISQILTEIQDQLYKKALEFRNTHIHAVHSLEEFENFFSGDESIPKGFAVAYWSEAAIGHPVFAKLKVTPRCLPLSSDTSLNGHTNQNESGQCIFTQTPTTTRVIFGKSY